MHAISKVFEQRRDALKQQLESAETLKETAAIVRDELDAIRAKSINNLTPPQARVAIHVFEGLKQSIAVLATADRRALLWEQTPPVGSRRRLSINSSILQFGSILICTSLIAGVLTWTARPWFAWPALLLVMTALVFQTVLWFRQRQPSGERPHHINVRVNVAQLVELLANALDSADRALVAVDNATRSFKHDNRIDGLEAFPDFLELLQDLLAEVALGDQSMLMKRAEEIPTVLRNYDICVKSFDKQCNAIAELTASFDLEPSLDSNATKHRTLRPALVRDGRTLARGRVALPADESPNSTDS